MFLHPSVFKKKIHYGLVDKIIVSYVQPCLQNSFICSQIHWKKTFFCCKINKMVWYKHETVGYNLKPGWNDFICNHLHRNWSNMQSFWKQFSNSFICNLFLSNCQMQHFNWWNSFIDTGNAFICNHFMKNLSPEEALQWKRCHIQRFFCNSMDIYGVRWR